MDLLRMDRHTAMLEIFVGDWIANFRSSLIADFHLCKPVCFVFQAVIQVRIFTSLGSA